MRKSLSAVRDLPFIVRKQSLSLTAFDSSLYTREPVFAARLQKPPLCKGRGTAGGGGGIVKEG